MSPLSATTIPSRPERPQGGFTHAKCGLFTHTHTNCLKSRKNITLVGGIKMWVTNIFANLKNPTNVSDRDVGPDTISDMFRARTRHHPCILKLK